MVVARLEMGVLEAPVALQATFKSQSLTEVQYPLTLQVVKRFLEFKLRPLPEMVAMALVRDYRVVDQEVSVVAPRLNQLPSLFKVAVPFQCRIAPLAEKLAP
jgi:hypothetical protein